MRNNAHNGMLLAHMGFQIHFGIKDFVVHFDPLPDTDGNELHFHADSAESVLEQVFNYLQESGRVEHAPFMYSNEIRYQRT